MSSTLDPQAVVQRPLDAYNRLDLEAFMREFTEDVEAYRMPSNEAFLSGKRALFEYYRDNRFNLPKLHSRFVEHRLNAGHRFYSECAPHAC